MSKKQKINFKNFRVKGLFLLFIFLFLFFLKVDFISAANKSILVGNSASSSFLYLNGDTDRLGIGITNPATKLHVTGSTYIGMVSTDVSLRVGWDTNNHLRFGFEGGSPIMQGVDSIPSNGGPLTLNPDGGNVGIGSKFSGSKLSVAGNLAIGAAYSALAAKTNGMIVEGAVGIGITNPQAKLDIFFEGIKNLDLYGLKSITSLNNDLSYINSQYAGYFVTSGTSNKSYGLYGEGSHDSPVISIGVKGFSSNDYGLGVYGENSLNVGVKGYSLLTGTGVYGQSQGGIGVYGQSGTSTGVYAYSNSGAALKVESNAGYAAIFEKGKVRIKNLNVGGAVMVDTSGDLYVGSGAAKYVGKTTATYTGDLKWPAVNPTYYGYTAGNKICDATVSSSSHMCTGAEILNTINTGNSASLPFTTPAYTFLWVSNGPPGSTVNSNDCMGWTYPAANAWGPTWVVTGAGEDGSGSVQACNNSFRIACCK